MNRSEFKKLARIRLKEGEALLATKNFSGAYYLFGYVVECGLKACIAKQTKRYEFPDKNIANLVWTHDLEKLVNSAGLKSSLEQKSIADNDFAKYWGIVKDWKEDSRYQIHGKEKTYDLYNAIIDDPHGVLKWIEQHW